MVTRKRCGSDRSCGFTLIELIITIMIIGILSSIAIPKYLKTVEKGRTSEAKKALGAIRDMELVYYVEYMGYTDVMSSLNLPYPSANDANYYFTYAISGSPDTFVATATRATTAGCKPPASPIGYALMIYPNGTITSTSSTYE